MTWFDIRKLEKDLIEGNISEKEAFNYLLITMLILTIAPYLSDNDKTNTVIIMIELIFGIIITIMQLKNTFDINTNGNNKEYFKRYISLSFVSLIRLFVFGVIAILPILIAIQILSTMGLITYESIEEIFELLITVSFGIAYYFMLTNSFKRVNGNI